MNKTIVTKENLKTIAGYFNKFKDKKYGLVSQYFYPPAKKLNSNLNNIGIKNKTKFIKNSLLIQKSIKAFFEDFIIDIENEFIRIHNNKNHNSYMAFIINIGDKITIKNNRIFIKSKNIIFDKHIDIHKIEFINKKSLKL